MTSAADGGDVKARVCLAVTCGLPGAGKTTLCKALLGISHADVIVRHICFDDFLQTKLPEKEENDVTAFQASRKQAIDTLRKCLLEGSEDERDTLVIADDNMYYRSMRYQCAQLARELNTAYLQLYIPCSLTDALARNGRREGQERVPQGVIWRMADRLEAPNASAFGWERETLILPAETLPASDADAQDWADIWRTILDRWRAPLEAAAEAHQHGVQTEASSSEAHALDLQLRRMLADAIAHIDRKDHKARAAQVLNARRKQLLQGLWSAGRIQSQGAEEGLGEVKALFADVCKNVQADMCSPGDAMSR